MDSLIDKTSPIPVYQQIINNMIDRINFGEWSIGEQLPTEFSLSEEYEASRVTVRQSMAELERKNIIERKQGKGAYLVGLAKPFVETLNLPSPDDNNVIQERKYLHVHIDNPAPRYVQKVYDEHGVDSPLIYLCRTFIQNNYTIALNHVWMPYNRFPEILDEKLIDNSISKTLKQRYHCTISHVDNCIEAKKANALESSLLEVPYDSALLKIISKHYDDNNALIHFSNTLWVGSLIQFQFSAK